VNPRLQKVRELANFIDPARVLGAYEVGKTSPVKNNAGDAVTALDSAFDKRVDQLKPGASVGYNLVRNTPESFQQALQDPSQYAGSTPIGTTPPTIAINPNADRAYLAHEMGHLATRQTDIGHLAASLRANPNLKKALLGAMVTVPAVASMIEEGDDDLDTSMAIAALASTPTLVDEALATKNGLAIMDGAGMRATMGQRGKLAGGLLSYLATPLIAGAGGNLLGNQFDNDPIPPTY